MDKDREIARGFLGHPIFRLGYPVVPLRLHFGLIIVLPFFTFLAVMVHINFGWFNFIRQLYLISGLLIGIAGGFSEAFFVTRRLKKEVEVVAWFLISLSFIFWLLPTAFIYLYFGSKEFLPSCAYFYFLLSLWPWLRTVFCSTNLRKGRKVEFSHFSCPGMFLTQSIG